MTYGKISLSSYSPHSPSHNFIKLGVTHFSLAGNKTIYNNIGKKISSWITEETALNSVRVISSYSQKRRSWSADAIYNRSVDFTTFKANKHLPNSTATSYSAGAISN